MSEKKRWGGRGGGEMKGRFFYKRKEKKANEKCGIFGFGVGKLSLFLVVLYAVRCSLLWLFLVIAAIVMYMEGREPHHYEKMFLWVCGGWGVRGKKFYLVIVAHEKDLLPTRFDIICSRWGSGEDFDMGYTISQPRN